MKPFDYQKYLKNNPLLKEGHEAEIGFGPAHQKPEIEEAGGFTAESDMSIDGVDPRAFDLDHTIYTDDQGRVDMNNGWPRLYRAFKSKNMKDFNYMADQLYSALEDDPYTQEEFGKFVKRIIAKLGGGYNRFDATNVDAEDMEEFNESEASQEKVTEVAAPVKAPSPTAVAVTRFWRSTFLPFVEKRVYDIDIESIEDALDSVAGKRISTGQLPEFGKLNTAQLQKVILFLMQVIKRKKFDMFDTWDKKTNTIVRDTDEDDDYFEESEDPSQEKVTEGNRPWDFNVYDMDAMQMAQFKKAAERLGFKARLDEVGIGMVEIRLWPSNDITFKQAFKILEKMGLEFDESHGIF